jgi:hypothetical protein
MPTPTHVFARIAARLGGVDPTDMDAVQRWYQESLANLSLDRLEKLLEELLAAVGEPEPDPPRPVYPEAPPLPTLDQSPAAE